MNEVRPSAPSGSIPEEFWPRDLLLARSISDIIVLLGLDLTPLSVSPSVERFLGVSVEEFVASDLTQTLTPASMEQAQKLLSEELARDDEPDLDPLRSRTLDLELRRSDGSSVWGEALVSFVRDRSGKPVAIAAVVRDISAWRDAQEKLRRSEERLRQIIDLVPHFVFSKDMDGRFLLVNRALAEAYGTTVEELIGRTDADFARSEEEVRGFRADDLEVIASGKPKLIPEEKITDSTGREHYLQTVKIPFTSADGGVPAVLGVATDITLRRQAEERLRQIIDLVPHFVFAKDMEGRFLLVNWAVAEAYGTTVEELTGKTDADFARSEEEVRNFRADDLEVLASGTPKLIPEEKITDATGHVHYLQTIKIPFTSADGGVPAILGVSTDISERRLAEQRLRASEEQLRQDQKMRAIGQLAGGVAHDFNNLLTVILGHVQTMLETLAPGERWRAEAVQIGNAAERAAALTRQLLAFSRKQLLTPVALELDSVVRETEQMLRRLIGEAIELTSALGAPYERVKIDRGQLDQILFNLSVNARDAMPSGGALRFETSVTSLEGAFAERLQVPPGDYLRLSVVDAGHGMDAETRDRAFEPFFTTKPGGTGLGLSTVYGIVEGAGGTIAMTTAPGQGTRVDVYLPRLEAEELSEPAAGTVSDSRGGETILIVEDEEAIRRLLSDTLEAYGFQVLGAADAEAAIVQISGGAKIDLLLTDVVLPGMTGPKLVAALAEHGAAPAVLFMSGYPQDMLGQQAPLPERAGFIAKPFKPRELAARVRELLDRI